MKQRKCPRCGVALRKASVVYQRGKKREETVIWFCNVCGYTHQNTSRRAPERHRAPAGKRRIGWREHEPKSGGD